MLIMEKAEMTIDKIIELHGAGVTNTEIAKQLGWPAWRRKTVAKILEDWKSLEESIEQTVAPKNPKIMYIPDAQVSPDVDTEFLEAIGNYAADKRPDIIVCAGDFFDFPSLSSYDKGTLSFEGRRLREDIDAGKDAMNRMLAPIRSVYDYKPRMVFTLGNHECVEENTEVLTNNGWKPAKEISLWDHVASYTATGKIEYANPVAVSSIKNTPLVSVIGDFSDELVSDTHRIDIDGELQPVKNFVGHKVNQTRLRYAVDTNSNGIHISNSDIKVITWVVADATIVIRSDNNMRIQFKLSRPEKIDRLTSVLDEAGIVYTIRDSVSSGVNKLTPKYICIYGDSARYIVGLLGGFKQFPAFFKHVSRQQLEILLEELVASDAGKQYNKIAWNTTSSHDAEVIQLACIANGVPFKYIIRNNASGFKEDCKPQYSCSIANSGLYNRRYVNINEAGYGTVVAITTHNDTLITRRNGKVSFTGNSRLMRIPRDHPEFEGFVGYDLLDLDADWEVHDFLKPVNIEGIYFVHYLQNPMTGKPYGGSALTMLKNVGNSFVMGHKQVLDVAIRPTLDGRMQLGIVAGASYVHDEAYKGYQGNNHFRGIVMLHNANNGFAEPAFISTQFLLDWNRKRQ